MTGTSVHPPQSKQRLRVFSAQRSEYGTVVHRGAACWCFAMQQATHKDTATPWCWTIVQVLKKLEHLRERAAVNKERQARQRGGSEERDEQRGGEGEGAEGEGDEGAAEEEDGGRPAKRQKSGKGGKGAGERGVGYRRRCPERRQC